LKSLLLALLVVVISSGCCWSQQHSSEIDSKTYGTWNPPHALVSFWKGMHDDWWIPSQPKSQELNCYFDAYTASHDVSHALPAIIQDLKANWSELRMGLYSSVILHWNREPVKDILSYYSMHGDAAERKIANEFMADIEEVDHEK